MSVIVATLLGGLFGWIYGGNALVLIKNGKWYGIFNAVDKVLYYIAYAVTFIFLLPILNIWATVILGVSQWARRAVSWGKYIGGLIHGKWNEEGGVKFIDDFLFSNLKHFKLKCALALGIIGGLGGAVLAAGLFIAYSVMNAAAPFELILIPVLLSLKGFIYWGVIEVTGLIRGQTEDGRNNGWGYSEIVYNAYMWGAIALLIN